MTYFILTDVAGLNAWVGGAFVDLADWEDHALTYRTREAAVTARKTQRRKECHLVVRSADEVTAAVLARFKGTAWAAGKPPVCLTAGTLGRKGVSR
jgi:hypothetical protein